MKKKPLEQYYGWLTADKVAAGMNAAAKNAKRLCDDAHILFENGRYATSCSLAVLSIEESGKLSLLRSISIAPDDKHLKTAWRDYRNHQIKNASWIIGELFTKGARTLEDLKPMFDRDSDHPAILDAVKQLGFYTDCCGPSHWSEPHLAIDKELAEKIIRTAEVLLPKRETTKREIDLWITYVGRHWGMESMFDGLKEFYQAMEREGMKLQSAADVDAFLKRPSFTEDSPSE